VETINKSKKDVQKFIKKELTSILINLNPKMDKKDFKKSDNYYTNLTLY